MMAIEDDSDYEETETPVAATDEDLITCHVCLLRFNEANRKPKSLDCHHYFCIKCIQSFSETASLKCPTCRHITRLDNRQVKDLSTNNIVLRLVSIATDRAQEVIEQEEIKQKSIKWCVNCYKTGTFACHRMGHVIWDFNDVFTDNLVVLNGKVEQFRSACDDIINVRCQLQSSWETVLDSLLFLQDEIIKRMEMNDGNIALLESKKMEAQELAIIPPDEGASGAELEDAMKQLNDAITNYGVWNTEKERSQRTAQMLSDNLQMFERQRLNVSISNCELEIELLKNLPLSLNAASQDHPLDKACVSVLSFMVLSLAEKEAKEAAATSVTASAATQEGIDATPSTQLLHEETNNAAAATDEPTATAQLDIKETSQQYQTTAATPAEAVEKN